MCKPEENPDYFRDMPYGSMTYLIECKLFTHLRLPIGRKQAFVFFSKATDSESAAWVNLQLCDSKVSPTGAGGRPSRWRRSFGDGLGEKPTDTAPRLYAWLCCKASLSPDPYCGSVSLPTTTALLPGTSVPEFTKYTCWLLTFLYQSTLPRWQGNKTSLQVTCNLIHHH